MIKMYGIPNCDTIKKACNWLKENNIDYAFHNYKKDGVPKTELKNWVKKCGWKTLLNKRGTTWRKLDEKTKESVNQESAINIMLENASIIKRPVLVSGKTILVGFNENEYSKLS